MKKRILIVDDEQNTLNAIQRELRRVADEYEVYTTTNSKKVPNLINEHQINLLITDILMPEKDGIEVAAETLTQYPSVKIITISGGGQIEAEAYLEMTKTLGISHTLRKPFNTDELLAAIRQLLEETEDLEKPLH